MALAFCLSALIFFIWRHRCRRRGDTGSASNGSSVSLDKIIPSSSEKPELDSKEIPNSPVPSEMHSARDAAEMPVPHFVAELPGSMPASYQDGKEKNRMAACEDMEPAPEAEHERSDPKSTEDAGAGHCRRRSILKGQSLQRTISSPSTPSAGSARRDVSSIESFESVLR